MAALILALKAEITLGFVKMRRYPIQTLTSLLVLYVLFIGLFYGSRSIAGVAEISPVYFARSATEAIAGYLLWFFALMAIDSMSQNIEEEAQTGTLEQFYLSRWSFSLMLFFRFLSSMLGGVVMIVPLLLLLGLSTGVTLDWKLSNTLPIIGLTMIGLCGLGYLLSAMTLVFKRIGNTTTLIQFGLLFLSLSSVERLAPPLQAVALTLPLTQGIRLLRLALVDDQWQWATADFTLLVVNSIAYLAIGILVFRRVEAVAKSKGLLGHY